MTDILLAATVPDSAHYLRAVTDMAEQSAVVAQDAIYTANGIKLVEKGVQIDSHLYDRLVQHKLREPIDKYLTVENAVDTEALLAAALALTTSTPLARLVVQALGSAQALLAPLRAVPLPAAMAFKLTVMREQHASVFQHSLQMVLISIFLGIQSGLDESECAALAAAALLHDIGMLHMNPAWLAPEHKMSIAERKHLVAHPITAMLMVRDAQVYPRAVEVAVLEHHERMDGTGYPRSLSGANISPLGRILLLAEVVTAFYDKYSDMPAQQLSLVLRLNHRKFSPDLVSHVLTLVYEPPPSDAALVPLTADVSHWSKTLAQLFGLWERMKESVPEPELRQALEEGNQNALGFIDTRLRALAKMLTEAGAHPDQQSDVLEQLQGDATVLVEIAFVGREALWQLQNIVNAAQRHWPPGTQTNHPADVAAAQWCEGVRAEM
ncbi:MAG: HD domain-containing protein [Simplicispira sp.]|nr:HD domain-containing protein [Simplicispira sp.]